MVRLPATTDRLPRGAEAAPGVRAVRRGMGVLCFSILVGAGCAVADISLAGRQCPCVAGYVCNQELNLCESVGDAGESSGGDDSSGGGPRDGGSSLDGASTSDSTGGCPAALMACNGSVTCTDNDVNNCGSCGYVCESPHTQSNPTCSGGSCVLSCAAGYGNCDGQGNNGCETDLSNDAANCGSYGHACVGTACTNGACMSSVTTTGTVYAIAAASSGVYWEQVDGIYGCPNTGCAQGITTVSSGQTNAVNLPEIFDFAPMATDGTSVFWVDDDGNLVSCPVGGCTTPTKLTTGPASSPTLVVDDTSIYWVNFVSLTSFAVAKCAKANCKATTIATEADICGVLIDSTNVYWPGTTDAGPAPYTSNQQLQVCPKTGCGAGPTAWSLPSVGLGDFALATPYLYYWAVPDAGNKTYITACLLPGCASQGAFTTVNVAADDDSTLVLAADTNNLYWGDVNTGLSGCTLPACADAKVLVPGKSLCSSIAINAKDVFMANDSVVTIYQR